jgi:hypothetical protein
MLFMINVRLTLNTDEWAAFGSANLLIGEISNIRNLCLEKRAHRLFGIFKLFGCKRAH